MSATGQGLAQKDLELRVDAAQLNGREALDRFEHLGPHPHQEGAFTGTGHDLAVQRTGIEHGLGVAVAAEHDQ